MEKINLVSDIIKISLKFDHLLKNGSFCEIRNLSDNLKSKLRKLKLISDGDFDDALCDLCEKINKLNVYAVDMIERSINEKKVSSVNKNKDKNILLFFYIEKCKPSVIFTEEWNKLIKQLNGKVATISINCTQHPDMCKQFNVYEYPTIKYVTKTNIIDYYGAMTADEIIKEFNF